MDLQGRPLDPQQAAMDPKGDLRWYDVRHLTIEGKGWTDTIELGDRFPRRAQQTIPPEVWEKSLYSSGICVRFVSDTDRLFIRWRNRDGSLPVNNTSLCRPDVYIRSGTEWRWVAIASAVQPDGRTWMSDDYPAEVREYLLYFPVLSGVSSMELGLGVEAKVWPAAPRLGKPLVFYGTSITCGQYASRPGLTCTAWLGRWLDCPMVNLGLPGHGRMEPEVVQLIAEIDAAVFVLECLPNMQEPMVTHRVEPAVRILRQVHPDTPIVLADSTAHQTGWLVRAFARRDGDSNAAQQAAFARLQEAGVGNLHYVRREQLVPEASEETVDGTHANDIGFLHMARVYREVIEPLLSSRGT